MTSVTSNTYQFSCQVVEVIYKEEKRVIKAICNPGSLIILTPDAGLAQLGDRLLITGTLHIESIRNEDSSNNRVKH